jgi:hypothetical protein
MSAIIDGDASWIIEGLEEIETNGEFEKKYKEVLIEQSKFVGAACN